MQQFPRVRMPYQRNPRVSQQAGCRLRERHEPRVPEGLWARVKAAPKCSVRRLRTGAETGVIGFRGGGRYPLSKLAETFGIAPGDTGNHSRQRETKWPRVPIDEVQRLFDRQTASQRLGLRSQTCTPSAQLSGRERLHCFRAHLQSEAFVERL